MNEIAMLEHLEEIATKLGVRLRYDDLGHGIVRSQGGYCKVGGQPMIIMNKKDTRRRQITILARSLNKLNLEGIFVPPALRRLIESHDN